MISRSQNASAPDDSEIVPLTAETARHVHLALMSRFSSRSLAQYVEQFPGTSFCIPGTSEYVVGGPWRHREDIGEIAEFGSRRARQQLLDRLVDAFRDRGAELVVLDFDQSESDSEFYGRAGFESVERIVEFERTGCQVDPKLLSRGDDAARGLIIRPFAAEDLRSVLDVDHRSFPWLWWNSPEEFELYASMPGVRLCLGELDQQVVGYSGWTVRGFDGHLDRLAIRDDLQGRGFGAALLVDSLRQMGRLGVRYVALTTQEDNIRSQALYRRFGFKQGSWSYEIQGIWLV